MRIVLAYSGGLDTSVILKLLQEKLGAEVVTVTVDVGQEDDLGEVEQKAYKLGAKAHYTVDAKEEFVRNYAFKAVLMNALYDEAYPLSTALARPLIAEKVAEVAKREGADAVAHGCTGKGNDQLRFDIAFKAMLPGVKIIAPVREWGLNREWEAQYAAKHGIPVKSKAYSIDENLWGRSVEGGVIEDITVEPPEEIYAWTTSPAKAPNDPLYLEIEFSSGVPEKVNGERMGPVEMVRFLNHAAGAQGVGRVDMIENRVVGLKSREIYEVPAATVLITAHKELERLTLTKRSMDFKGAVDEEWAKLVYQGLWFDPLREALEAFAYRLESRVTGSVKLKLFKGSVSVVGRSSPYSLYDFDLISYFKGSFDQKMAIGFVELFGFQAVASYRKRPS